MRRFQIEPRGSIHVVGADIVEFNLRQDVGHLTENLAAKLAKEIAAKMLVRANFSPGHGRASSSR